MVPTWQNVCDNNVLVWKDQDAQLADGGHPGVAIWPLELPWLGETPLSH